MLDTIAKFLSQAVWAITPAMLDEIYRIYDLHAAGGKPDIAAIEASLGRPLRNDAPKEYKTVKGVALIPVTGVIAKKMDLMMQISGGTSTERLSSMFKTALADPQVSGIILVIDSPGGTVDGLYEVADFIFSSLGEKPCYALAYGCAASAAYLIAAACDKVYASDVATQVGSIGVAMVHRDTSKKEAATGVVTTEIYRGKYKRIVTSGPLTDEGIAHLTGKVDYLYTLFVNDVARFRGVDPETVLATMSTDVNDLFIGRQAVEAGLVDGIMPLDSLIETVSALPRNRGGSAYQGTTLQIRKEDLAMEKFNTLAELTAAYPEFAAQLKKEGAESVNLATATEKGTADERKRVLDLLAAVMGDEDGARITALVNAVTPAEMLKASREIDSARASAQASGTDSPAEAQRKQEILNALKTSGAPAAGAGDPAAAMGGKDYMALVDEYAAAHKCSKFQAMQAVNRVHPDARQAYIAGANKK